MSEQIITSSILILAICLIRALFAKRISPTILYALWLLAAVKHRMERIAHRPHTRIVTVVLLAALSIDLVGCTYGKAAQEAQTAAYNVQDDTHLYRDDTQIGTLEIFEDCEFASSIEEFIEVQYMSDASVVENREIAAEGDYTLLYVELSVSPSAAMEIQGESPDTEWHYYIHDGANYFVDVRLNNKEYCTEELETYLLSYIK